jgi:hypothetical protein
MRHAPKLLWLVVLGLCLLSVPLTAEEPRPVKPQLARTSITPTRVEWLPLADHDNLVLTVAGPENFYFERELRAGETPSLSALDVQDNRLPDGVYAYELRSEGAAVQSGHLWVQEGRFVDQIPADVKPPIRNITALEEIIPDDLIVQGHACIGGDCVSGDASGTTPLRIKGEFANRQILFDGSCCYPTERDWALQVVDPSSGPNGDFVIRDQTSSTTPFKIGGGAPENAFTILYNGNIGLGTLTPDAKLHLYGSATSDVFESLGPSPASGPAFNIGYGGGSFGRGAAFLNVRPDASATAPNPSLRIMTANVERMIVTNVGDVGIGTSSPAAQLHVRGTDSGFRNRIFVENASGTTTPREMLELRNNGSPVLILKDTSLPQRWGIGMFGSSYIIDNQANTGVEFTLGTTGNLTIAGTLTQNSDRTTKHDIVPVQPEEILGKVLNLPIATWVRDGDEARHLGPMAQDFAAAFGLGEDDRHIATIDMAGVSLASIQALNARIAQKDAEIETLRQKSSDLATRVETLEKLISSFLQENAAAAPTP